MTCKSYDVFENLIPVFSLALSSTNWYIFRYNSRSSDLIRRRITMYLVTFKKFVHVNVLNCLMKAHGFIS